MAKKELVQSEKSREGRPILFYLQTDLVDSIKILGKGNMSRGMRQVLNYYSDEINKAAKKAIKK